MTAVEVASRWNMHFRKKYWRSAQKSPQKGGWTLNLPTLWICGPSASMAPENVSVLLRHTKRHATDVSHVNSGDITRSSRRRYVCPFISCNEAMFIQRGPITGSVVRRSLRNTKAVVRNHQLIAQNRSAWATPVLARSCQTLGSDGFSEN